ncbi:hypothetical protein Leryth_018956 [Lithospermum erythrorhizon]|uniref:Translation initiation factor n=1 Tax=Lithospermum erythrorhizon TaxID=34254 RepID=A0AAV3RY10_LITER|nr:hypothetical protein Leryth_018956 [Lithospermum erythrorhizon]
MALLNIGAGNQDDAFYRYKMPRMITKIEGRGNGIKTNIVNMVDIAKALSRPASYTTKYFGIELGAQSKFDEKTGTSHVNGSHETAKLATLLEVFIKKYVQCYGCGNPETDIVITKSHMIALKCAACGFISEVDMRDKLTTFIVKNPPDDQRKGSSKEKKAMRRAEKERLKEGEMADEEQKKLKKDSSKRKGTSTPKASDRKKMQTSDDECFTPSEVETPNDDDSDAEVEWQTDTSSEAAMQRIQEQLNSVTAGMVMLSTGEEKSKSSRGSLSNSPSREKLVGLKSVRSRDKLSGVDEVKGNGKSNHRLKSAKSRENLYQDGVKDNGRASHKLRAVKSRENLLDGSKENKRVGHRLKSVGSWDNIVDETSEKARMECKLKAVSSRENLVIEIKDYLKKRSPAVEQLKSFLGSLSGTQQEIVDALFEALFNEVGKGLSKEVVKKKNFLTAATPGEGSQLVLLHSIESFCEKANPDAVKEVALVLKSLYDNDVLEENFILEWYQKGIKAENKDSMIWKNVKPFVEWLQSAESETEGE